MDYQEEYIKGLIERAEGVNQALTTRGQNEANFIEKLHLLLGYISALKVFNKFK